MVVDDAVGSISKTATALDMFKKFGAEADIDKSKASKKIRAGKGKMRNRRYTLRKGPLVVYAGAADTLPRAVRNIGGVDYAHVDR